MPSGTFFRSVLLGGVDAPTGGEAQNASPHPVLMRVTDFAQLPNRFKYNFRECFVTGQAYGDISSERAYIRLQNLSCVGTDGRAIDMPVKGYVAGEDGKTGVRGNLVTKQGQLLANALMSGVISGMGKGVSEAFKVTNNTAFGSTTSIRGSDQYRAGIASGIGGAADRLAEYYIKLADKVFPVVEVNAGRQVDVVLTQGIEIDTGETK
ncbi:TraB/VirB10 family protein [Neisseria gonorrhoeae]